MIYILEIKEEARQDILLASEWYTDKSAGISIKFIQQLEFTLKPSSIILKHLKRSIKIFGKLR